MLWKTHLAIGIFFMFIFLPVISQDVMFSVSLIVASLLPDIASPSAFFGKGKDSVSSQAVSKNRGVLHSFTLAFLATVVISLFFPTMALGFFLGYSVHLFSDSFTTRGIQPFWPLKGKNSWKLRTGGYTETSIFIGFLIGDLLLLLVTIL
ncbi:hypothetical protein COU61_03165 [Candidatus Pacearchaeota archaeon CG10_big_fil_rev_8_21_14_0_10_35_13]|nr:MAG: hypothetical protein COU61_03165 [Candidatus Pacearchaeota archaeon CG10_big_fil_rev_8_21_14_0_10_35_13]